MTAPEESETQNRAEDAIEAFQSQDPPAEIRSQGARLPLPVEHTRRFFLWRTTDVTGVTVKDGEEPKAVAVGVQFPDGMCSLWWYPSGVLNYPEPPRTSIAVWTSLEDLERTHLHPRSQTELVWVD